MASLSHRYLAEEKDESSGRGSLAALIYTFRLNLLPMLMATENKMDTLPIIYLKEHDA